MTNYIIDTDESMLNLSLFKIIPLIKPFFKEMFMGGSVPTAGKTRNRLLPVLGILSIIVAISFGALVINWISSYDKTEGLELRIDKLEQQLNESSRLLALRNEESRQYMVERRELLLDKEHLSSKLVALERAGKELLENYQEASEQLREKESKLSGLQVKYRELEEQLAKSKHPPVKKKRSPNTAYADLLKEN